MKNYIFSLVCLCCTLLPALEGQAHEYPNHPELRKSDANIVGHILDKNTKVEQVIYTHSTKKIECMISNEISQDTDKYIESFGCSDCKCRSHLYYFDTYDEAIKSSCKSYEKIGYMPYKWYEKN